MSRYTENYKLIDWGPDKELPARQIQAKGPSGPFLMPDITPFISPIDFTEISSRSKRTEHERKYGVRQCGELNKPSDYLGSREHSFNEKQFEKAFKTALERTGH